MVTERWWQRDGDGEMVTERWWGRDGDGEIVIRWIGEMVAMDMVDMDMVDRRNVTQRNLSHSWIRWTTGHGHSGLKKRSIAMVHYWVRHAKCTWSSFNCTTHINVCMYVRSQFMLFCCRMCCFLCRKCCLLQCCCVIFMQIVLILYKLCWYYANCVVLMQIVLFWCKLWHLSQFTLFCRKWHFCREIRVLAGTFGSAIRRLLLLMMSGREGGVDKLDGVAAVPKGRSLL